MLIPRATLLFLLLSPSAAIFTPIHPPIQAAPIPQTQLPTNPIDRIQQLIDRQRYDQAWQEIRRLAQDADRAQAGSLFPMPATTSGNALLQTWSLNLGIAEVKTDHYQAALQLAKDSKFDNVRLDIAKALYQANQKPLANPLFTQLAQNARRLAPIETRSALASLSATLFKLGATDPSNQLLEEAIRSLPSRDTFNEQWTLLFLAGLNTDNLDRTLQIADRLDFSQDKTALESITRLAIQKGNIPIAERYLKKVGRLPTNVLADFYLDLAALCFTQNQTAPGLAHLSEASIYNQLIKSDPGLERVARLYQAQKQNRKALAIANKIQNPSQRQALLAQLQPR